MNARASRKLSPEEPAAESVYCSHCGFRQKVGPVTGKTDPVNCQKCQKPLNETLSADEQTSLVQILHKRETHFRDVDDGAMTFLVLGIIFLILGGIFFSLAFKLNLSDTTDNVRHLDFTTFEFWIAAALLLSGAVGTIYAIVRLVIGARNLRVLKHDIAQIRDGGKAICAPTGLWLPEFFANSRVRLSNFFAVRRALKQAKKK